MNTYEVHRDDGELLGFVEQCAQGWIARTVFGAPLADAPDRQAAEDAVTGAGLAALAERWWHHDGTEWVPARIVEAAPGRVTAFIGALPATPRRVTLTGADAAALRRDAA